MQPEAELTTEASNPVPATREAESEAMPDTTSPTHAPTETRMSARQLFQHALELASDVPEVILSPTQLQKQHPDRRELVTILREYGMEDGIGLNIHEDYPQLTAKIIPGLRKGTEIYRQREQEWTWDQVKEFVLQLAQDAMDAERVQTSPETESGSETGTEPDRKPRPGPEPEPEPRIQPETEPIHPHEYLKATHTNYDLGEKSQEGTTTTSRAVADPTNNTELTNETVQRHPAKKAKDDRPEQASQPACAGPARATKMKDITIEPENLPEVTTMKDGSGNEPTYMTTVWKHVRQPMKETGTSARKDKPQLLPKTRAKIERHLLQVPLLMNSSETMNAKNADRKPSPELTLMNETEPKGPEQLEQPAHNSPDKTNDSYQFRLRKIQRQCVLKRLAKDKTHAKTERHPLQTPLPMSPTGTMSTKKVGQKPSTEVTRIGKTGFKNPEEPEKPTQNTPVRTEKPLIDQLADSQETVIMKEADQGTKSENIHGTNINR